MVERGDFSGTSIGGADKWRNFADRLIFDFMFRLVRDMIYK